MPFERRWGLLALIVVVCSLLGLACESPSAGGNGERADRAVSEAPGEGATEQPTTMPTTAEDTGDLSAEEELALPGQKATFAGGCFWCMEPPFEKLQGVKAVVSGYAGGEEQDPSYEEVAGGRTGHTETVQIVYDPQQISYEQLLDVFWRNIDPTDPKGQFVDRGRQYRPAIFYHSAEQKRLAQASAEALAKSGRFDEPLAVEITELERFWPAEAYHQDFYKKSPQRYYSYRRGSGRDQFLETVWGGEK